MTDEEKGQRTFLVFSISISRGQRDPSSFQIEGLSPPPDRPFSISPRWFLLDINEKEDRLPRSPKTKYIFEGESGSTRLNMQDVCRVPRRTASLALIAVMLTAHGHFAPPNFDQPRKA